MKKLLLILSCITFAGLTLAIAIPGPQPQDQQGCKDYPLLNRMPNYHIVDCETVEFDSRKFPVGPPVDDQKPRHVEVEGARTLLLYELNDGAKPASGLQIMRNFENAAKTAGGTVQGTYPDLCKTKSPNQQ
jgi:OmpA-OmpF porin, OOP family